MNILHITPDFNYACGRSYYVFLLLKYLSISGHNIIFLTNGGDSLDRLEGLRINLNVFRPVHSRNPVSYARGIIRIKKLIREFDIDIVHTYHRYSELLGALAVKGIRNKNIRTVFTSLSIVNRKYNIEFSSDYIIAVSNAVRNMLVHRFGVSENKVEIIPNFTDTEEANELGSLAGKVKERSEFFNILSVGRFHHEKSFGTLLKALKMLDDPSIKLFLIGEGEEKQDYLDYTKKNSLNVELIAPKKNLLEYFHNADICVLPSTRDPFPAFMLQSGLHKKPFIGTDVDGIAELISDGKNGLLFRVGNESELADKIKTFKSDSSYASKCAENLHKDVINNYTQEFIIPKIEKLYIKLLADRKS